MTYKTLKSRFWFLMVTETSLIKPVVLEEQISLEQAMRNLNKLQSQYLIRFSIYDKSQGTHDRNKLHIKRTILYIRY